MGKDHTHYILETVQARNLIFSLNCVGHVHLIGIWKNQVSNYFMNEIIAQFIISLILLVIHKGKRQNVTKFESLKYNVPKGIFYSFFHCWISVSFLISNSEKRSKKFYQGPSGRWYFDDAKLVKFCLLSLMNYYIVKL